MLTGLVHATDPARFGGKAAALARAAAAGMPVPPGLALDAEEARAVASGAASAIASLAARAASIGAPLAVRSSAIGEDGARASFAGQHATLLGVAPAALAEAVAEVVASAGRSRAYRARLGLPEAPMAVIVQALVPADAAGVAFSVDPRTGRQGVLIEASWGLGEVVVTGRVTPDRWWIPASGPRTFEPGIKDLALLSGGAEPVELAPALHEAPCLDDAAISAVCALLTRLDTVFQGAHDVEFAFAGGQLWLLQRRPVTFGGPWPGRRG